jgi:hypothetical protein
MELSRILMTSLSETIFEFNSNADFGSCSLPSISVEIVPDFFIEDSTVFEASTKDTVRKSREVAK